MRDPSNRKEALPRILRQVEPPRVVSNTEPDKKRSIFISWTRKVFEEEGQAMVAGIQDILAIAGEKREIIIFGSNTWYQGDWGCADWYQDQARKTRKFGTVTVQQIGNNTLLHLLYSEPRQAHKPHTNVMLIDEDLFDDYRPESTFLYGAAVMGHYVQSVYQFRNNLLGDQEKLSLIRRLARHEFGHTYGLPSVGRQNTIDRLGIHCSNICSMRQGVSISEWLEQFSQEEYYGVQLCNDCIKDLQNKVSKAT